MSRLPTLVFAVVVAVTSCSTPAHHTVDPGDAADGIAATFSLPDDQRDCLADAFRADRDAADVLDPALAPSDEQLRRLGEVERSCVQLESLAASVASSVAAGVGGVSADQQRCVHDSFLALSPDAQLTMMAGLATPNAQSSPTFAVEMGRITNGLFHSCNITAQ